MLHSWGMGDDGEINRGNKISPEATSLEGVAVGGCEWQWIRIEYQ
jgi:hypothetical protein